jgi:hypothetical protein
MDISHDHTNFGAQIPFLRAYFLHLHIKSIKSIYFLHLYENSDRLMGHMTYFNFEPASAQRIQKNFGLRYPAFLDF